MALYLSILATPVHRLSPFIDDFEAFYHRRLMFRLADFASGLLLMACNAYRMFSCTVVAATLGESRSTAFGASVHLGAHSSLEHRSTIWPWCSLRLASARIGCLCPSHPAVAVDTPIAVETRRVPARCTTRSGTDQVDSPPHRYVRARRA